MSTQTKKTSIYRTIAISFAVVCVFSFAVMAASPFNPTPQTIAGITQKLGNPGTALLANLSSAFTTLDNMFGSVTYAVSKDVSITTDQNVSLDVFVAPANAVVTSLRARWTNGAVAPNTTNVYWRVKRTAGAEVALANAITASGLARWTPGVPTPVATQANILSGEMVYAQVKTSGTPAGPGFITVEMEYALRTQTPTFTPTPTATFTPTPTPTPTS